MVLLSLYHLQKAKVVNNVGLLVGIHKLAPVEAIIKYHQTLTPSTKLPYVS